MAQRIYRILFLLFVIAGGIRLSAQTSDAGVWIVGSRLEETSVVEDNDDITIDFDEDIGWGISFNHFWTERFSTEIAAQKFGGDMTVGISSIEGELNFTAGELDATSLTALAQLHFRRATRFAPYVGAGLAHVWGEFDPVPDVEPVDETFDLEAETTWAAAVGANVRITERIFFVGEMKYIPWEALAEDDEDGERLDVNPLTFSAGVKVRF